MKKLYILLLCMVLILTSCSQQSPIDSSKAFVEQWKNGKYDDMYGLLSESSKGKISKEDFTSRYNKIFSAIGLKDMEQTFGEEMVEKDTAYIPVDITFHTNTISSFKQSYTIPLVKEKSGWKIDWSTKLIFPSLEDDEGVYIEEVRPKRGSILDRYQNAMALDGEAYTVGAVPGSIPDKEEFAKNLGSIIEVTPDYILKQLSQKWVKDDTFVPLKSYPINISDEFKNQILAVKGVKLSSKHIITRQYPYEDTAAHITGYVQKANKEDMEKHPERGYDENSLIGRSGIERSMNDILSGKKGYTIYIKDKDKKKKSDIAKLDVEHGDNVVLSIDGELQTLSSKLLDGQKGSIVVLQPITGEVLTMASNPSYDPNPFPLGISSSQWEALSNNEDKPFVNRAISAYTPGSTLKPFIAAMGLTEGVITPHTIVEEAKNTTWRPSDEWGDRAIHRTPHPDGPVNLRNAIVWSDNIYFAWTALNLGGPNIEKYAKLYSFGVDVPFPLQVAPSQIKKGASPWIEPLVADTGYGQGEVLISPLQLASMYTVFSNNGSMVWPKLVNKTTDSEENIKSSFGRNMARNNMIDGKTNEILLAALIDTVEDPSGTAHGIKMPNIKLAAKTGTAQINEEKDKEIAWIVAFTVDQTENPLLVCIALEVPANQGAIKIDIAKKIFETYYNR